jgi:FlaA1/EpsC-like NDP-sugar epimerase
VLISVALWAAFLLRFDFFIPAHDFDLFRRGLVIALVTKLLVFLVMHLDRERSWRYLGFTDMIRMIEANVCSSMAFAIATLVVIGSEFPRSVYVLDLLLCFFFTAGFSFAARLWGELAASRGELGTKGLVIYGAGVAGIGLAREIRDNPKLGYKVIGFLDDDPHKHRSTLMGLPVLGTGEDAIRIVASRRKSARPVDEIVVTMPSATGRQIRAALNRVSATGVRCRIVPGLGELISGKLAFGAGREISVADLLGRDPVKLEATEVRRSVAGKSVLVTGAAGSIGSELCRQLGEFAPRCLIILDQAESELFRVEAELRSKFPDLQLIPELADIRDPRRLDDIIRNYCVHSIFHAAAYKHVPIVERHICEGVRNNVLGTWNIVQAACRNHVSSFVMISTDKAVNPTSVMGLTKRVAELLVTARRFLSDRQDTRFVCVRFGNVLVSNGSVVPIFQKQIAAGGPVMVTHPEVQRYFMTVEEAVQLVLHASTMGKGSEIFVLEMGKPVRIVDLARKMITLVGFTPDEDIEIRFSGLRRGEKLFEELNLDAEQMLPTSYEKIKIFSGNRLAMQVLIPWVAELQHLVYLQNDRAVLEHMKTLVPEYQEDLGAARQEPFVTPRRIPQAYAAPTSSYKVAAT